MTFSLGDTFSALSCLVTKSPPIGAATDSLHTALIPGFPRCQGHHPSKAPESPKPREGLSLDSPAAGSSLSYHGSARA